MTRVQVEANVEWKAFQARGGSWVAICDALQLTIQAETWINLMEDINLTLNEIFRDLLEANELDQFLRDKGWRLLSATPRRPEEVEFDIPFIAAMVAGGQERHVHQ